MDPSAENESVVDAREAPTNAELDADSAIDADDDAVETIASEPLVAPVLPVRNICVFPGTVVPLTVGREKSRRLIDSVLAGDKVVAIFTQRDEGVDDPGIDDVYRVGTLARVLKLLRTPDGGSSLLVHGVKRAGLERFVETEPFWKALVNPHEDAEASSIELDALAHSARQTAESVIELSPNIPDEAGVMLRSIEQPGPLADFLAANLSLGVVQKQELLETFDVAERLRKVNVTLNNQLEVLQLSNKIQTDVRKQIDESQRTYFLQEQLKAIQKELGEASTQDSDVSAFRERIAASGMPEDVATEAERELTRLARVPQASPEYGVIRDYLEWLCDMPWQAETETTIDLDLAEAVLDEDHFGLERIKRRILEYLAVLKLNPTGRSPILCFAGPPGVGKTSLGQSIARAVGREFIRLALGGVRDEADIRGHRRTYIGAMPGRIVQELRKVGVRNPVIMLDELDKLGADFRGDPASALLEVLDPAQNHTFTDHYLGAPFDLSHVLFIGTANYMDPVAPPLKDRMEIINLSGYTTDEKLQIAKRYLVRRQLEDNGLLDHKVEFQDDALRTIIENYTREAGVRNLERLIGAVCRGIAAKVARGAKYNARVTPDALTEHLGPQRFHPELALRIDTPGVVTGLAYTPVGGEIIFVEARGMPGRGSFQLTGQIGDVMRESAQAALSLIRSRADEWRLDITQLPTTDIHIHVPAGGIPKDGPSAGVAMMTALVSMLAKQPVKSFLGMTGEITLRGDVLPIGGVKEKVLAAHRAGIRTVIIPKRNAPDLDDVPTEVRQQLEFVLAERAEDVLNAALPDVSAAPRKSASRRPAKTGSQAKPNPASRKTAKPASKPKTPTKKKRSRARK